MLFAHFATLILFLKYTQLINLNGIIKTLFMSQFTSEEKKYF